MNITKKTASQYISREITDAEIKGRELTDTSKYYIVSELLPEAEIVSIYKASNIRQDNRLPKFTIVINKESYISTIREIDGSITWSKKSIAYLLFESAYYVSSDAYDKYSIISSAMNDLNSRELMKRIFAIQSGIRDQKREKANQKIKDEFKARMDIVPALEKDFDSWVENVVTQTYRYIFYNKKGKTINGYCSYCKNDVSLEEATHLKNGKCPHCKSSIIYRSTGLSKKMIDRFNFHLIQNTEEGMVIRYFDAEKNYISDLKNPKIEYNETYRCLVKDKNIKNLEWFKWDYFKQDKEKSWVKAAVRLYDLSSGKIYTKNLKKVFKNSAFENCALDKCSEYALFEPIEYLKKYLNQPYRSILVKEKLYNLAFRDNSIALEINKEANSAEELLNISKSTLRMARKFNADTYLMELLITLNKMNNKVTSNDLKKALLLFNSSAHKAEKFLKYTTISELYDYIVQQIGDFKRTIPGANIRFVTDKMLYCWRKLEADNIPFSKEVWFPASLRECLFKTIESENDYKIKTLPKEFDQKVLSDGFDNYLFYYKDETGTKAYCSHCKSEFKIKKPVLNEEGVCPCCLEKGIFKQKGREKQLKDSMMSYCIQKDKSGIVIRGFICQRDFKNGYAQPSLWKEECERWILRPKRDNHSQQTYSLLYNRWSTVASYISQTYKEEAIKQFVFMDNVKKELKNTPWEYCALEEFHKLKRNVHISHYLKKYLLYPQLEFLVKMGLIHLVETILNQTTYFMRSTFNEELEPLKFLGVQKQTLKKIVRLCPTVKGFQILRELDRYNLTLDKNEKPLSLKEEDFEMANELVSRPERISELLRVTSIGKLYKYINEQPAGDAYYGETKLTTLTNYWLDYVNMVTTIVDRAKAKNKPIKDFPLYPKNLKEYHNIATDLFKEEELEIKSALIKERQHEWSKYEYIDEEAGYLITAPKDAYDFINESNALKHCVKSYMDRAIKGSTTILFVRSINEPNKPLYTLEYLEDKIVQFRGHSNSQPDKTAIKFVTDWDFMIKARAEEEAEKQLELTLKEKQSKFNKDWNVIMKQSERNTLQEEVG